MVCPGGKGGQWRSEVYAYPVRQLVHGLVEVFVYSAECAEVCAASLEEDRWPAIAPPPPRATA